MAQKPKYRSVWQKMLQEDAAQNAAATPVTPNLEYDLEALPDTMAAPSGSPQLDYRLEGLIGNSAVVTSHVDRSGDPTLATHMPGTARAPFDGVVMRGMTGWQNPRQHRGQGAGMGWRTWIQRSDGSRVGYGHLDPSSTLPEGTRVRRGDPIGRYSNPTNGHSSGPHVHVQAFDHNGSLVAPPAENPFGGRGHRTRRYGERDAAHRGPNYPNGHQGDDWVED